MFNPQIIYCLQTGYLLLPFILMEVIMLSGPRQLEVFLPDRKKFNNVINDPRVYNLHTLNMLIGE